MSIAKLVREYYDNEQRDIDAITAEVLQRVLKSSDPAAELRPLVEDRVRGEMRRLVRSLERRTDLRPSTPDWTNPATAAREKLLREEVWVPGAGRVPWGQLTIDQHQRVISHYRISIAGMELTLAKHSEAIAIIQRHPGAQCLDDCELAALIDA